MYLSTVNAWLALAPTTQQGQQPPPMWTSLVPLVLIGVVFYFLFFRPQQKKNREMAELLKSVRPGDKILTSSGIVAVVVTVKEKEKTVTVRSADAKFEMLKSAIAEIMERSGESKQS